MTAPAPPSVSELREDAFTGRPVVVSPGRADRPAAFAPRAPGGHATPAADCPFCAGHERRTPPEVWADRQAPAAPDTPGWQVRVIPNKYPAFSAPANGGNGGNSGSGNGHGGRDGAGAPASGRHEVVVHGPAHRATLDTLQDGVLPRVVAAWRRRLAVLRDAFPGAVTIIVNQGREAGASLEHSHSQMYATAFRPDLVAAEATRLAGPGCAACAAAAEARATGDRLVADDDGLVTLCPWASSTPMEALLLPAAHGEPFEAGDGAADEALAAAVAGLLRRLRAAVGFEPALNLVLHTAPPGADDFHWHLHLYPRLTTPAGFELGTGVNINVLDPAVAAARLRAAAVTASPDASP